MTDHPAEPAPATPAGAGHTAHTTRVRLHWLDDLDTRQARASCTCGWQAWSVTTTHAHLLAASHRHHHETTTART